MLKSILGAAVLIFCAIGNSNAALIGYEISGIGSGSISGVGSFTDQNFTFRLIGDTDKTIGNRIDPLESAEVSISGIGTAIFNINTRFGLTSSGIVFFSNKDAGLDLFDFKVTTPLNIFAPFETVTSVEVPFALNQFNAISTSLGDLSFDASSLVTFSGSAVEENVSSVPVPAALPLLATALGGLGLFNWRKRRNAA